VENIVENIWNEIPQPGEFIFWHSQGVRFALLTQMLLLTVQFIPLQ
jgi:hypothetical protein